MPSNRLILCCPLLLLSSILPSIRVFSNELALCIRWLKYWSFSFSISPSNEYSGLISCRMDWFDLLAVQGESSPTPQFRDINSSVFNFLYGPTLTFVHDYWENSEKVMAPHSSTLAWKIPWTKEPGRLHGVAKTRLRDSLSLFKFMHWRRKWQPTPVFLPGESQGRWSLVGCRLWGRTESDTTEAT